MFDRDKQLVFTSNIGVGVFGTLLELTRVISEHSNREYNISSWSGMAYHVDTPKSIVRILDRLYELHRADSGYRVRIWYGDVETGRAWGDVETGRIGRSMGIYKIPLIIHNTRSMGGGGILDHCIVRIDRADLVDSKRIVLYQHPDFHLDPDADQWVLDKAN